MDKPGKMPAPRKVEEIPGGYRVDDAVGKDVAYCYGLEPKELPAADHLMLTRDGTRPDSLKSVPSLPREKFMLAKVAIALLMLVLAIVIQQGNAQAEPKGWRCEYRVYSPTYRSGPRLYNCYGTNLRNTSARTKARCGNSPRCIVGACLPLDFAPGSSCER